MPVRIEKYDAVWTVIHSRPETRNAMDPDSAVALYEAYQAFDTDDSAHVAVFWGEGGRLLLRMGPETRRQPSRAPKRWILSISPTKASPPWPPWDRAGWLSRNR